jgi:hypothetical protein
MRHALASALLLPLLAGCAPGYTDPFQRAGTWRPEHDNDRNLAAMVADPAELRYGTGDDRSAGDRAALAVARLRADQVKPLPDSGLAQIVPVASGNAGAAPPPPMEGGPN